MLRTVIWLDLNHGKILIEWFIVLERQHCRLAMLGVSKSYMVYWSRSSSVSEVCGRSDMKSMIRQEDAKNSYNYMVQSKISCCWRKKMTSIFIREA